MNQDAELQAILNVTAATRRWLRRALIFCWGPLIGRCLVAAAAFALVAVLATFHRPGITTSGRAHVSLGQVTDTTGTPVSRDQWVDRATALYLTMEYCTANPDVKGC